ncbi:hypothetical protein KQI52_13270 [bacterium]|nr:hypothetical protein [bacterium]
MPNPTWNPPPKVEEPFSYPSGASIGQFLALMDDLQMIAWQHAELFGLGYDHLQDETRLWVLTRLFVRLLAVPEADKTLTLRTWPTGYDKRQGYRDFLLLDGGTPVAEATSAWAVLERESRAMVDMAGVLADRMPGDVIPRNLEFTSRTLPRLKQAAESLTVVVTEENIDVNGHVNNLNYLRWAVGALPATEAEDARLVEADMMFRAECFAGDELRTEYAAVAGERKQFLHSLIRNSDNREVARILTVWK